MQEARTQGTLLAALGILGAALAAYANSFGGAFVYDDFLNVVENPYLRRLWPPGGALWAVPQSGLDGRPLTALTFAVNRVLGGLEPSGYHAVNLAIHAGGALALFGICRRTLQRTALAARALPLALVVSATWVAHPLTTSAVTYVYQRCESLMGALSLLAIYAAVRALTGGGARWTALAGLAACLAVTAKETAAMIPLVVLLWDRAFVAGSLGAALRRHAALFAALLVSWGVLGLLLATGGAHGASVGYGFGEVDLAGYLRTQCNAIPLYARLAVWPVPLVFDYGWPVPRSAGEWVPGALLTGAMGALTLFGLARRPRLGFLGAWFFLWLAPTSSVLVISTEVIVERRAYLSIAAVLMLVALGADALLRARLGPPRAGRAGLALSLAALAAAVGLTHLRNRDYATEESLWRTVLDERPDNPRAHNVMGTIRRTQGRPEEARAHFARAVELQPAKALWRNDLATALLDAGDVDGALEQYREAVRLQPRYALAFKNLGTVLAERGEHAAALDAFDSALGIQPLYTDARKGRALALAGLGRDAEAGDELRTVLGERPGDFDAVRRLGWILVRSADPAVRDPGLARNLARRALERLGGPEPSFLELLAAAWAELGDGEKAIRNADLAAEAARRAGRTDEAARLTAEAARYRARFEP